MLDAITNTLNKILTFLVSRRNWAFLLMFLVPVFGYIEPFISKYFGESYDLVATLPVDQRADVLLTFIVALLLVSVTLLLSVTTLVSKLLESMHERPATLTDWVEVIEIAADEVIDTLRDMAGRVEDFGRGELPEIDR